MMPADADATLLNIRHPLLRLCRFIDTTIYGDAQRRRLCAMPDERDARRGARMICVEDRCARAEFTRAFAHDAVICAI